MASSPSEGSALSMYVWRRIKSAEGGGRNLANGRNYGRVGTPNPRNKRCYAYNILHFRLFLPYYRPCRFVFFLGGLSADGYREDGVASWYGRDFHGKTTANGERYNMYAMTAAHKLLPLGTKVRVTHLRNGKSIVVRVNDRGPFVGDRIIDLSYASAKELGMIGTGTARVRVEAIETFGGASPGDMNGSFYIQIAALSSQASAQELVRRLQNRNLGGRAFYAPSLGLWRVQAGPFNSLNRAEDLSDELNRQYPGNFVVAD